MAVHGDLYRVARGCAVALSGFDDDVYSVVVRRVLRGGKSRRTVSELLLKGGAGLM
jgi:hypothetical protein